MNFARLNLQPPKLDNTTLNDFAHGNSPLDLISALLNRLQRKKSDGVILEAIKIQKSIQTDALICNLGNAMS